MGLMLTRITGENPPLLISVVLTFLRVPQALTYRRLATTLFSPLPVLPGIELGDIETQLLHLSTNIILH